MDAGPEVVVVGAPLAAATSLDRALGRHPGIVVPRVIGQDGEG